MKRKLCSLLSFLTLTSLFTSLLIIEPKAAVPGKTYGYACNTAYSTDFINDDGSFTNAKCTNNINEAKEVMYWGRDYVVRARDSKSPTKIVMMNGGLVYSYPQRLGRNTLILNEYGGSVETYVTYHREMKYEWTDWLSGDTGGIVVSLNGFYGTVDLKGVDLIPWKYIEKGIPITLGGNDRTSANEQPFHTKIYQQYYSVENGMLTFHWSSGWSANGEPAHYNHNLGPVDGNIPNGVFYSYDGYNFYYDRACQSHAFTYYNYYQYLPMRSKTNLSADDLNKYIDYRVGGQHSVIKGKGQAFINAQEKYGVNAALLLSIACLESATGTSQYAVERNNLFGIAAYDSDPNNATYFKSVDECINQMAGVLLKDYMDIKDYRHFGMILGNKGTGTNVKYAADPYWGIKIGSIYFEMDRYINGSNLKDYNTVKRGVVDTHNAGVYLNSNGSHKLFNTANKYGYQKNLVIPITGETGDYYQFQCNNNIENGAIISNGYVEYDWDESKAYIKKSDVTIINSGTVSEKPEDGTVPTGEFAFTSSVKWLDDTTLQISGSAYRPGIKITDENKLTYNVTMVDKFFVGKSIEVKQNINDDAIASSYSFDINVDELENGIYKFYLDANYSKLAEYNAVELFIKDVEIPNKHDTSIKTITFSKDSNGIFIMNVNDKEIVEQPEENNEDEPSKEIIHYLDVTLIDRKVVDNSLTINGLAYLTNLDALEENASTIAINVSLVDLKDENVYPMDVTISSLEYPIPNGDKIIEYALFEAKIEDINKLPISTFRLMVEVINGNISDKTTVRGDYSSLVYNDDEESIMTININRDQFFRVEFSTEIIPEIVINTTDLTKFLTTIDILSINIENDKDSETDTSTDKAILSMNLMSFLRNINIGNDVRRNAKIYIVNKVTGKVVKEINSENIELFSSELNIGIDHGYEVTNGLLSTSFNIADLVDGTYYLYLEQTFNFGKNIEKSLIEISSNVLKPFELTIGNRSYSYTADSVRNRLEITINTIESEKTTVESNLNNSEELKETITSENVESPVVLDTETSSEIPTTN